MVENLGSKIEDAINRSLLTPIVATLNVDDMLVPEKRADMMSKLNDLRASFNPGDVIDAPTQDKIKDTFAGLWSRISGLNEDNTPAVDRSTRDGLIDFCGVLTFFLGEQQQKNRLKVFRYRAGDRLVRRHSR